MTPRTPLPPMTVTRRPEHFLSDDKRVILRFLDFGDADRMRSIIRRIARLPTSRVAALLREVASDFATRHRDIAEAFGASYRELLSRVGRLPKMSTNRQMLIGAYFTMEYSVESAALFNPSIVPHPDQVGIGPGCVRFLMSLRATGEGHLSSIVLRRGVIDSLGRINFDPPPRYAYNARRTTDQTFEKAIFRRKLRDTGDWEELAQSVFDELPEHFTTPQMETQLQAVLNDPGTPESFASVAEELRWLVQANYTLRFPADCRPAETVIFPATKHESRGMEDLRLVQFTDDDGEVAYYGTYTAYDGFHIHPMLLETRDFLTFHVSTLTGRYVQNKGMALFPRKVGGYYLMLARHDGENNFLMRSHNLYVWNTSQKIQSPVEPWELVQLGNCGSPMETDAGWLVITHGVGAMREYSMGALLLDLEDPSKVIGRLRDPLLSPTAEEREGYVPNVVYSCGSMIHGDRVVIPYAMSDARTAFATVKTADLVARLLAEGA